MTACDVCAHEYKTKLLPSIVIFLTRSSSRSQQEQQVPKEPKEQQVPKELQVPQEWQKSQE